MVSGSGREGSIMINQDAEIFLGKFKAGKDFDYKVNSNRRIWVQMIAGKVLVNGVAVEKGDAAAIEYENNVSLKAEEDSEFLLFSL